MKEERLALIRGIVAKLEDLRLLMLEEERLWHQALAQVDPVHASGARNLLHFVALRRGDHSALEARLGAIGLSLDADPSNVLHRLDCLLALLRREELPHAPADGDEENPLEVCTRELLGPSPAGRRARIMVTLGPAYGADADAVHQLVRTGVDCVRINCARDGRDDWASVAAQVRRAAQDTGRRCAVFMDMAGAKLRIADLRQPGGPERSLKVKRGTLLNLCSSSHASCEPGDLPLLYVTGGDVVQHIAPGAAVWFDDGKIGGKVVAKENNTVTVSVTQVKKGGATLRPERSVNLPDSDLSLPLLTAKDEDDLRFARDYADMVGLSFVRSPETISRAGEILGTGDDTGIVVKVENVLAVERLPLLMLEAMKRRRVGVLLARGDLAVECGYERLAALQDETVAFCEAAALPLFWATEILDTYMRKRRMTRPEMTDVASAARAECVMLNRGDDLLPGVALLGRLLHAHNELSYKGRSRLMPSPLAVQLHRS